MEFMTVQQINEKLVVLVKNERKCTEEILNHIILFQNCNGYLKLGYSSMHEYLTRALGYSDDQSYRRMKAAKLMQAVPEVGNQLKAGNLNLSQAAEVQKAIETSQKETGTKVPEEKKKEIIKSVEKANNFNTKNILANELNLKPKEHERSIPQSNQTVRLEINLTQEQFEKLKTIKSLLSHKIPDQNTGKVLECLFDQYLNKNTFTKGNSKSTNTIADNTKSKDCVSFMDQKSGQSKIIDHKNLQSNSMDQNNEAAVVKKAEMTESFMKTKDNGDIKNKEDFKFEFEINSKNKSQIKFIDNAQYNSSIKHKSSFEIKTKLSRYIPIEIRKALFKRAQGCCEYLNEKGIRCDNRYKLEIDHALIPFSQGGHHTMKNLILACSNHNSYRANQTGIGYETTSQFVY